MDKSKIRHILDLSKDEKRAFVNSFDSIMSDCDGVVWNFTGPIPGVDRALQLLRDHGKKLAFISNNGMRTMDEYAEKFRLMGIEPQDYTVVHPALTIVKYLKSTGMRDAVYCIATEVFKNYLREAGFTIIDGPTERIKDDYTSKPVGAFAEYFQADPSKPKVGAVVLDIDANICLPQLMKATTYLKQNPDCLFIAGATDYTIPLGSGMEVIGSGHFIDLLEKASGRRALVLGKPGQALAEFVLEQFHITQPERTLFVGDMLPQDMGFGARCGFQRLLVLSGGTNKTMLLEHDKEDELPNYYASSFADFIQLFKEISSDD
ncbi:uncharacterized protein LOC129756570 [Uranotaenia lowii]|uniref:uncharacterized protein LOC129756570 n=1 Tax=Uranotaenia lowii TaxID=190385 RepID=UPI00247A34CB|nr:uncharacterized protein LOC129756570 [Uranotaenia lowii]